MKFRVGNGMRGFPKVSEGGINPRGTNAPPPSMQSRDREQTYDSMLHSENQI